MIAKLGIKIAYDKMSARYYTEKLQNDPEHEFFITAHSHGCSRLNNIGDMLTSEQRQHMNVEAFGPATIISKERFKDVTNYLSKFDCVPWTSTWSYVRNVAGFDSNVTFLTPHSFNPLTEHYLLGETYWKQITENGGDFVFKYLSN